ncbi:AAA domain-containing protein, putative AbiEii toxin, Type IV TA system [Variovorax sp. YR266]|uniref:AAA family ATPase n=1 Tax=Variovorax sp. YR266 TaxID=1884386 RepID=UPI000894F6BD|nr:AAA family ATPase [Variovorax sp. YR266]SDZ70591.1 AAA domain-containing protein, putative AbiEii toxin, Type IV TA system [Variovorax sp. YR266]
MLKSYTTDGRSFEFVEPDGHGSSDRNTFTVIVGRNGTGKSRLLRSLVINLIGDSVDPIAFAKEERLRSNLDYVGTVDTVHRPSKVICVSTSPFDRFPLFRRDYVTDRYSYLGLRGLPSTNLGVAYLSRIVSALIGAAARSRAQASAISKVLRYLGYEEELEATFLPPSARFLEELVAAKHPQEFLYEYIQRPSPFPIHDSHLVAPRQLLGLEPEQLSEVLGIAARMVTRLPRGRAYITVGARGVKVRADWDCSPDEVILLANSGLLKHKEVVLSKRSFGPFLLHEASSGEQAVVMSLLGIGSQIADGALICIDEPEVCLHPEWQEKYIELLFRTFNSYRGCHFVIATHSPQIVAQLPDGNCYVMAMEDGVARRAARYAHRSIDFQLAEVFNAPGYKNEYLNRIALNVFARVSKSKELDPRSHADLETLRRAFPELRPDDPLRDLVAALEELARTYG